MMDDDIRLLKINGVMTDDFFYNKLSKKSIKSVQMTASKERILKICEYCGKSFMHQNPQLVIAPSNATVMPIRQQDVRRK